GFWWFNLHQSSGRWIILVSISVHQWFNLSVRSRSGLPGPLGDCGHECLEALRFPRKRAFLFGAHVGGHEHLNDFEAVVEGEVRGATVEETLHEVAVVVFVTVFR